MDLLLFWVVAVLFVDYDRFDFNDGISLSSFIVVRLMIRHIYWLNLRQTQLLSRVLRLQVNIKTHKHQKVIWIRSDILKNQRRFTTAQVIYAADLHLFFYFEFDDLDALQEVCEDFCMLDAILLFDLVVESFDLGVHLGDAELDDL